MADQPFNPLDPARFAERTRELSKLSGNELLLELRVVLTLLAGLLQPTRYRNAVRPMLEESLDLAERLGRDKAMAEIMGEVPKCP